MSVYVDKAKQVVVDHFNEHVKESTSASGRRNMTTDDAYVVWFCKTLQNWKALVSTDFVDGVYYEVTYNGNKDETYVELYKKHDNKCIK